MTATTQERLARLEALLASRAAWMGAELPKLLAAAVLLCWALR